MNYIKRRFEEKIIEASRTYFEWVEGERALSQYTKATHPLRRMMFTGEK